MGLTAESELLLAHLDGRPGPVERAQLEAIEAAAVEPWRKRLAAVHKSGACGGSYRDAQRQWCDCGYLTLLEGDEQ